MKTVFFFFCTVLATDVFAVNCAPLDPRDSVSKQQVDKPEAQVEGSEATLLKLGEFERKLGYRG